MSISYISELRKPPPYKPPMQSLHFYAQPRHVPHSKVVRHINGLNNAPICSVQDDGLHPGRPNSVSKLTPRERELLLRYLQPPSRGRGQEGTLNPLHPILGTPRLQDGGRVLPRPGSQLEPLKHERRQLLDGAKPRDKSEEEPSKNCPTHRAGSTSPRSTSASSMQRRGLPGNKHPQGIRCPVCKFQEESRKSSPAAPGSPASRPPTRQPSQRWSRSPRNHPDDSKDLDYEFNVLSKLCHILQTDSLADARHWIQTASPKEKEEVADMIRSIMGMESSYKQDVEGKYAKDNLELQSRMNGMPNVEAEISERATHTRPASRISEVKMNGRQENSKDVKQHVPMWQQTAPGLDSSDNMITPSRPMTIEQKRKPIAALNGKAHLRFASSSTSTGKPSLEDKEVKELGASEARAANSPVVSRSMQTQ
ncbi:uncharacterized protein LOC144819668 [Lissotriton helveticus]